MIIGTLLVRYAPSVVLFDLSSINTILAQYFVDRIGMDVEDLGFDLRVSTSTRVILTTSVSVTGVIVMIQ